MLLLAAVVLAAGIGIQLFLDYTARRDVARALSDRAAGVVSLIRAASTHHLTVPPDALNPGIRVYNGAGRPIAGGIELRAQDAADDLAHTVSVRTIDADETIRLRAVPFSTSRGDRGVVVVSQDVTPYERSERYAMIVSAALGLLVVGAGGATALRVSALALRPVGQMAQRAADWSEHDLSHRFDMGPATNELTALGETLDHLLDRVAMAIRSEQRLTSELAHELRTPLTAVRATADVALLRGVDDAATHADLEQISASAREMSAVISTLLELARQHALDADRSRCQIVDVVDALKDTYRAGIELVDLTTGSHARIAAPANLVLRALAPLVDNACRHASTTVTLTALDSSDGVRISVADDGPGVDESVRRTLFDSGSSATGGTGLGLGIARRIARSLGGDVILGEQQRGATLTLLLPRA